MTGRSYKITGLILGRFNYREADRVLTILTRHRGKKKILARSVRKLTSKRAGQVEIFNRIRGQVHRGKGWDILGEVGECSSCKTVRQSLAKISTAYQMCELVDRLVPEEEENKVIYDFLLRCLKKLDEKKEIPPDFLAYFKMKLLSLTGFWPEDKPMARQKVDTFIEELIHSKIKSKELKI